MSEFNLSNTIYENRWVHKSHVKEFIERAEDLLSDLKFKKITWNEFAEEWSKLVGGN